MPRVASAAWLSRSTTRGEVGTRRSARRTAVRLPLAGPPRESTSAAVGRDRASKERGGRARSKSRRRTRSRGSPRDTHTDSSVRFVRPPRRSLGAPRGARSRRRSESRARSSSSTSIAGRAPCVRRGPARPHASSRADRPLRAIARRAPRRHIRTRRAPPAPRPRSRRTPSKARSRERLRACEARRRSGTIGLREQRGPTTIGAQTRRTTRSFRTRVSSSDTCSTSPR